MLDGQRIFSSSCTCVYVKDGDVVMADPFLSKRNDKYDLQQKQKLGKLCLKYKLEAEAVPKKHWNPKRKKHVAPSLSFKSKAVREFFPSLKNAKSDDSEFKKALQLATRCYRKIKSGDEVEVNSKKKFREPGAGRKPAAPEVRQALFEWFVDVRGTLKARLPRRLFKLKCEELYEKWLQTQAEEISEENKIRFSDHWLSDWCKEYGVSLNKPNKRFALSQADRKERIIEFLKNVWRVRHYFMITFNGKVPVIINGDQMPLHRNESASSKTMTLKGQETYVKENYMLSRERVTVFTQV